MAVFLLSFKISLGTGDILFSVAFSRVVFGSPQQRVKHMGTVVGGKGGGGVNGLVTDTTNSVRVTRELHSSANVYVLTLLPHVRHVAGSHSPRDVTRHSEYVQTWVPEH